MSTVLSDPAPSFDPEVLEVRGNDVRLVAAYCPACDAHSFPRTPLCPRCGHDADRALLPGTGTVYSHCRLDRPLTIHPVPTIIVQVDLAGATISGWLRSGEPHVGASVAIRPLPLVDGERPITAYCFEMVDQEASDGT